MSMDTNWRNLQGAVETAAVRQVSHLDFLTGLAAGRKGYQWAREGSDVQPVETRVATSAGVLAQGDVPATGCLALETRQGVEMTEDGVVNDGQTLTFTVLYRQVGVEFLTAEAQPLNLDIDPLALGDIDREDVERIAHGMKNNYGQYLLDVLAEE